MPLDQFLAALERAASRNAEQLLADANAEAQRLTAASERDLAQRRATATAAAGRDQRAGLERAIADATRAARRDTLVAREGLLTRVFTAVRAALPEAIDHAMYRASLPQRVAAALACFDDREPAVIHCAASLVAPLQAIVAARTGVTVVADAQAGSGFRAVAGDGTIEVDDTLEARLDTGYASLARQALQQLEPAP